jgi:phosphatidylserine decarboxylase
LKLTALNAYARIGYYLLHYIQYIIPHHFFSRLIGFFSKTTCIWIKKPFIHYFIRYYHVDLSQAQTPHKQAFDSFEAFFTRAINPKLRPICQKPQTLVSPADSTVSQLGTIKGEYLIQAKKHRFSVRALLAEQKIADYFTQGHFITLYLAPKDYHRVHMPCDGTLLQMTYIPGRLFSVSPQTTQHIPGLFARNERVVCLFETPFGKMALILVGAMIVGNIQTVFETTPLHSHQVKTWHYPHQKTTLQKGAEMGRFTLGSTVIVLFENTAIKQWTDTLQINTSLLMGSPMATAE